MVNLKLFGIVLSILFQACFSFPETGFYNLVLKPNNFSRYIEKTMYAGSYLDIEIKCPDKTDLTFIIKASKMKCLAAKKEYSSPTSRIKTTVPCKSRDFKIRLTNGRVNNDSNYILKIGDSKHFLYTKTDGYFVFQFGFLTKSKEKFSIDTIVRLHSSYGFLSAAEYPFLIFYGAMCAVYIVLALIWLVVCWCNWRDILRLQLAIAAVIALGMLEKAFFVAEYHGINETGITLKFPILVANLVSCVKRSLARILIMIVCLGYGIVKPRLGPALRKITAVGVAYCVLASFESGFRVLLDPEWLRSHKSLSLLPDIGLLILDAAILWWSFSYLIQTIKQMRMRKNVLKFNLYRHFSNILIIVVIASVVFMVWALFTFKSTNCNAAVTKWKLRWVDEAFWHLFFSVILMTIMFLWRPSNNNLRYAYSPLLDAEDMESSDDDEYELGRVDNGDNEDDYDEDNDRKMGGGGGTRKKHQGHNDMVRDNLTSGQLRKQDNSGPGGAENSTNKTAEDDLKWIEENIPASAAEKIYPIVDSDEELTPSKISSGKMD